MNDPHNNLSFHGAKRANFKGLIKGGTNQFLDFDMVDEENIDDVKKQLKVHQIDVEVEDLGELSERAVICDTINDNFYGKKT